LSSLEGLDKLEVADPGFDACQVLDEPLLDFFCFVIKQGRQHGLNWPVEELGVVARLEIWQRCFHTAEQ